MALADLTKIELILAICIIMSTAITTTVGLKIVSKYFEYKKFELLTVGLMMFFLTSAMWSIIISLITFILFDFELPIGLHILISIVPLPIANLLWIYTFCLLIYPNYKRKLVSLFIVIVIIFEVILFISLMINPTLIATKVARFTYVNGDFVMYYIYFLFLTAIFTMILFLRESLKSNDPKIRWKGKIIFFSLIVFFISGILSGFTTIDYTYSIIATILIIISSTLGYIGWIMPDKVAKWLIKEE